MLKQSELDRQNNRIRMERAESVKNECMVRIREKLQEIEKLETHLTTCYNGLASKKECFNNASRTFDENVQSAAQAIFFSRELLDVICEDMKRICDDIGPASEELEAAQRRISDIIGNDNRGLIRFVNQELVSAISRLDKTRSDFQDNLRLVPNSSNLEVLSQIARKANTNPIFKSNLEKELRSHERLLEWFKAYSNAQGILWQSQNSEQIPAIENQSTSSVLRVVDQNQSAEIQSEGIRAVKREFASNMHPLITRVHADIKKLQSQLKRHKLYLNAHQNMVARPSSNFNAYVRLIEAIVRLGAIYQNEVIPVFDQINQILKAITKVLSEIRILLGCDLKKPETFDKALPHTQTLSKLAEELELEKLALGDYVSSISQPMFELGQTYTKSNPNDQAYIQQQLSQKGLFAWCQPWIDFFDSKNISQASPLTAALQSISGEQMGPLQGVENAQFVL